MESQENNSISKLEDLFTIYVYPPRKGKKLQSKIGWANAYRNVLNKSMNHVAAPDRKKAILFVQVNDDCIAEHVCNFNKI